MELKSCFNGRLIIETGDITKKKVDAIVNAANTSLMGGGGVDGAIHRAGGPSILNECKTIRETKYPNGLPIGEAVETRGGQLAASYIIHTVGPIWRDGSANESQLLLNAYKNSLDLAKKLKVKSIAFPAISTGVYRFPKDKAAQIVFPLLENYLNNNELPEVISLVFFDTRDGELFLQSIKEC